MSSTPPPNTVNTLAHFQRYIATVRSGPTAKHYVVSVRAFLKWYSQFGISLTQAPPTTLSQYSLMMLEAQRSSSTIHSHLAAVRRYFKFLHQRYGAPLLMFHEVEIPSPKRKVKETLSDDALTEFFRAAMDLSEPTRTAALLLPCSGLRCQEVVSLPLGCLKRQKITLADGVTQKDVIVLRVTGKGGHERSVPLLDEGAAALVSYLKGWRREQSSTRWLFPGLEGHMATRTLRKAMQKIRKPSGQQYTPHTMRRTYLTSLFRQGVNRTVLAKIGGHNNEKTLVQHYLDLNETDLASAVHASGGRLITPPQRKEIAT